VSYSLLISIKLTLLLSSHEAIRFWKAWQHQGSQRPAIADFCTSDASLSMSSLPVFAVRFFSLHPASCLDLSRFNFAQRQHRALSSYPQNHKTTISPTPQSRHLIPSADSFTRSHASPFHMTSALFPGPKSNVHLFPVQVPQPHLFPG